MTDGAPRSLELLALAIRRLRNVDEAELELAPGRNILVGGNGQGKTTVLEGAYLLGALRSFRGAKPSELLRHGASEGRVVGSFVLAEPRNEVVVTVGRGAGRELRVDGKRPDLAVHFHRFPIVAFHPGDLDIVLGSPADRRRFLDRMLFQAQAGYAAWHRDYRHALRSRNELLRREAPGVEIRAFDAVLADRGALLAATRARLCERLASAAEEVLEALGVRPFEVRLETRVEADAGALLAALEASLAADRGRRSTSVGPHADDLALTRPEGRARVVASRGEARSLAVALRLAERRVVSEANGTVPLLLLDDVAAELDRERTERVVRIVTAQGGQVIVTATGAAEEGFGVDWRRFRARGGKVEREAG